MTKIPHLGDIPFLGALFSYATQTEEEIELIVVLTPRLVDPADCSQMPKALPGSETRKPDDYEFYLETILEAPRGQRQIWNGLRVHAGLEERPVGQHVPVCGWELWGRRRTGRVCGRQVRRPGRTGDGRSDDGRPADQPAGARAADRVRPTR